MGQDASAARIAAREHGDGRPRASSYRRPLGARARQPHARRRARPPDHATSRPSAGSAGAQRWSPRRWRRSAIRSRSPTHDYRLLYVNPAFTAAHRLHGRGSAGPYPGRADPQRSARPEFFAEIDRRMLAGEVWKGRIVSRHKDGRLIHQDATISPIYSEAGELVYFCRQARHQRQDAGRGGAGGEPAHARRRARGRPRLLHQHRRGWPDHRVQPRGGADLRLYIR